MSVSQVRLIAGCMTGTSLDGLDAALVEDLQPFERLLEVVTAPYDAQPDLSEFAEPAPSSFGKYRTFCGT